MEVGKDKVLHFLCCFILTFIFYMFLPLNKTVLVVYTIGVVKELIDSLGYGTPEVGDIIANSLGIGLAYIIISFIGR